MKPLTYLDWAATAPLHPAAVAAMAEAAARLATGEWANPSSQHAAGRAAHRALEAARETIAGFLSVPADSLVFTSGGTEALGLALDGAGEALRFVNATEHAAVLEALPDCPRLRVDRNGLLDPATLSDLPASALVVVQQANNETGVIQDIAAVAAAVHERVGRLLVDAVQAAGKLPVPAVADFVAVSAHKLGGPPGVGALIVRCRDGFHPRARGGGQERGLRGGTENLLGILGFAAAVGAFDPGFAARAGLLQARLEQAAVAAGAIVNAADVPRLPTISSLHLPGVPAATQLMALDLARVAVSQGAACSSGTLRPSAVLQAMGLTRAAGESIRVSIGWATTMADIDRFLDVWRPLAVRARAA
jgi:cysteine desulfurase